ncbi:putative F-box and FNIP repeat-containing protein [Tupanvirus deep ocean]|uniref:F-box and FNIP repeat-containing protein n=2 Tax=Tupanvirus TaxID=2094720 RepID=A0AC62A702_9VIRU|nr:putative F-box and FNIP repeat-containing protein [Tupanvirus deep ocean]QKU33532.1 putative F-box and FNIP repeat-containing protein [Tupanvirus deep ocean]
MNYLNSDIVLLICDFLETKSKINFLSTCKTIRSNIILIRFKEQVEYHKIKYLDFFDSFTNVIVKNLKIRNKINFPRYIKHLTYENVKGKYIPIPKKLVSLCWLTEQKMCINKIPDSLEMLHIQYQYDHANVIVRNLKNINHLVVDSDNNVDFSDYYPPNVKSLVWNMNANIFIHKQWQLDYLCFNNVSDIRSNFDATTIEFNNVDMIIRYNNDPNKRLKTIILNSNNIDFCDKNSNLLDTEMVYDILPEHAENCCVKEIIFGKTFSRSITNIIPPSVIKCTVYEGYKGTFPPTVKEIIVLPRN